MTFLVTVEPTAPVRTDDTNVVLASEPDIDVESTAVASEAPATDEPADAPIDACLEAHENAQVAREHADLVRARDLLRTCSREPCPHLVTRDCVAWLAEVERTLPSVVFDVLVGGTAGQADALFIDGAPVVITADDPVIELNPGLHRFGARKIIDGTPVDVEIELLVQASVSRQTVRLELAPPPVAPLSVVRTDEIEASPRTPDRAHPLRRAGFAMLGVGAITGTATLVVGTLGLLARNRAVDDCAPFCAPDRLAPIRAELLAADVLGAVTAAAAIGTAVLLGLAAQRAHARTRISAHDGRVALALGPVGVGVQWSRSRRAR